MSAPEVLSPTMTGVGVVIDDCIDATDPAVDEIVDLLAQIREAEIPFVLYKNLPPAAALRHFNNIAFILLDWQLWEKPVQELVLSGVTPGQEIEEQAIKANLDFLKLLKNICFAPVFIFSHLNPDNIKDALRRAKLLGTDENRAFILVRKKSELKRAAGMTDRPLLNAVNDWIAGNPSIYVLSHWKDAVSKSQNSLFWDFYDKDITWPGVLWQTYGDEGDDPEHALAEMLLRNMRSRMFPLLLDPKRVVPDPMPPADRINLRAVLETSIVVPESGLPSNQYGCGDLFRNRDEKGELYKLNIRCDCDCIARDGKPDKVLLYLLNGRVVPEEKLKTQQIFGDEHGFTRPMKCAYLFPVDGGKCIAFSFHDIKKNTVADLKKAGDVRIGRITAPHITDIRQRYSQWLQREGLPKIPPIAVRDPPAQAK